MECKQMERVDKSLDSGNSSSSIEPEHTETKKQTVIVIPNQGLGDYEEEDGEQTRRSENEKTKEETVTDEQNAKELVSETNAGVASSESPGGVETKEIDDNKNTNNASEPSINKKPNPASEPSKNKQDTLESEQKDGNDHIITSSAVILSSNDTSNETIGDENKPYPPDNPDKYDVNAPLGDVDHTLTQSILLDEQTDDELARMMQADPGYDATAGGHSGCVMCEMCMKQGRPPETTMGVDYGIAFNRSQGHGQNKPYTPNNTFIDEFKNMTDGRGYQSDGRDIVFQQAISLMAERTVSRPASKSSSKHYRDNIAGVLRGQTPIAGSRGYPFGLQQPEYFYVHQQKPTPMTPVQAWKGYNGNVYFTPISIQQAHPTDPSPPKSPDMERCSPVLQQILRSRSRNNTHHLSSSSLNSGSFSSQRIHSGDSIHSRRAIMNRSKANRSSSVLSTKSNQSKSSSSIVSRPMLILDRRSVFTSSNDNIMEDAEVLASQESTGSLCVLEPKGYSTSSHRQRQNQNVKKYSERVYKGSNVHHAKSRSNRSRQPLLSVSGDKFSQVQCPSPLLRTQTQYSQSNQRAVFSPEMSYHSFTQSYEKLPPLEHLKASLRQIENSPSKESLLQVITPQERMKFEDSLDYKKQPYIKFSPELRHGLILKPNNRQQSVK